MKNYLFNVIIPSISIDNHLKNCLSKLEKQKYKKFFVTIILDKKQKINYKYKFKLNSLSANKSNMSKKRNLAAKKFKSDYIAFLDSDAYPNEDWLKIANSHFNLKPDEIIGGPNIPFPNEKEKEIISHYCKRSFFINGHLAYRKYKSKSRYIDDWLESCNFFISRKKYLEVKGMDPEIYIGEDQDFFKKLRKTQNIRVFFSKNLFVYHRDREIYKFFIQRFSFGLDVFDGVNFDENIKGSLVLLPFLIMFFFVILFFLPIDTNYKIITCLIFSLSFIFLVFFEIKKFVKRKLILKVITSIIISNILYGLAGFFSFLGLRKTIESKIYRRSR